MLTVEKVEEAIKSILQTNQISKHSVKAIKSNPMILEICLDSKVNKVDLDFCEKVSKEISNSLDLIDDSDDNYLLDVCSFGVEQPLETDQEIIDNVGSWIHIDLFNPENGFANVDGTLLSYENNKILIEYFDKNIKKKLEVTKENVKLIRLAVKL